jgi:glycosyltransferase involved in cell wall biosynthesis
LRVLALIASSDVGGAEQVFLSGLERMDRERFVVWAACHGQGPMLEAYGRHVEAVRSFDLVNVFDASTVRRLAAWMAAIRCDIVHTHLWTADVLGGLAAARAQVPVRVTTIHGEYFRAADVSGPHRARRLGFSAVYRGVYAWFQRVIAVSQSVRDDLVGRFGLRVPSHKITVIRNGLSLDRGDAGPTSPSLSRFGLRTSGPLILVVANFFPIKGHHWVLEALPALRARSPSVQVLLIGEGPTEAEIRRAVVQRGLDSWVHFGGAQPDARALMTQSSVVLVPSLSEGLPLVVLEALATGTPVVATRVGGIPEIIRDGESGLLVPPRDPAALTAALARILMDRPLAARLGAAGRQVVRERFDAADMVRRTEAVYLQLARHYGRHSRQPWLDQTAVGSKLT